MSTLTKTQLFSRTRRISCLPLRLTAIAASFFLVMPLLTGCGEGENGPAVAMTGSTASLEWSPVSDPSVSSYFVHYGRQSPDQPGSCAYESSVSVDSSSATLTNLDPNTLYYFTVSAYNGLESPCSNEVSTVTPPV
jgi:Fibronectin type III domain